VAAEIAPLVKAGGLGDVVGSLPKALSKLGLNVRVVIPAYKSLKSSDFIEIKESLAPGRVFFGEIPFDFGVKKAVDKNGIPLILIEQDHFFGRDDVYGPHGGIMGYRDNLWRFSLLAHASLHAMRILGAPSIVHIHDWSGSLVPAVVKQAFGEGKERERPRIVLTIHNLGYQGVYPIDDFYDIGIDYRFNSSDGYEHFGSFNALKGGIMLSDMVTTVSPTYAKEIISRDNGFGLDGELKKLSKKGGLSGILNGIDEEYWDPKTDEFLQFKLESNAEINNGPYALNDYETIKKFKESNKKALFSEIGLNLKKNSDGNPLPLLGVVSRLTEEKGIDVFLDSLFNWNEFPFQVVILGSGKEYIERKALYLAEIFKDKVYVKAGSYDEALSHKIYAASDIFVMPSKTEPCGLSQMISMRYGGVVLAGDTGGLHDTITDIIHNEKSGNGLLVNNVDVQSVSWAMNEMYNLYNNKEIWGRFVINSINKDFSWNASALKYKKLYEDLKT